MLVDVFLVVGDQGLGLLISISFFFFFSFYFRNLDRFARDRRYRMYLADGLSDGVHLAGLTTTGYAHSDVDVGELIKTDDKEGLVDLEPQDGGLNEAEGLSYIREL